MRRAARTDDNQAAIVKALRSAGCGVVSLAAIGNGVPDLLVSRPTWPHAWILLEVKDGAKPPSARELTPDQVKFHEAVRGPCKVVKDVAEALEAVGL